MQRSTKLALGLAAALAILTGIVYLRPQNTPAPRLTAAVADDLLQRIATAVKKRDLDTAFSYTAANAVLFGERRVRFERFARRAMRDASPGRIEIRWTNLNAVDLGDTGFVEFDLTIGERIGGVDTEYFRARIQLNMRKEKRSRWFGLLSGEQWVIENAASSRDVFGGP